MTKSAALDRVRIVLSHTSHPGNIGAAARAMKTMGLERLYLVNPRLFPDADADAFASGARDVLERAVVCSGLDEALAGTVLAVASSTRRRDLAPETLDCRSACARLLADAQAGGEVALVFGTERTGLTMDEVDRCGLVAAIPANPAYPSLNLAQAVQVFGYELRMAAGAVEIPPGIAGSLATHESVERFHRDLERTLFEVGFVDPDKPGRIAQRLRRLFGRARLEKQEINILRGLLRAIREKVE
jgi:tRNA/rRNA methyltransferase